MKPLLKLLAAASVVGLGIATTPVSAQQPIRIGVPTAIQLQVGRDTQNAAKLAADEINAKGGVLGGNWKSSSPTRRKIRSRASPRSRN